MEDEDIFEKMAFAGYMVIEFENLVNYVSIINFGYLN